MVKAEKKEVKKKSFYEQAFFMFYGILVGIVLGIIGNLWAQLFYEYVVKEDGSLRVLFWLATVIILIIGVVTVGFMVYFWRRYRHSMT